MYPRGCPHTCAPYSRPRCGEAAAKRPREDAARARRSQLRRLRQGPAPGQRKRRAARGDALLPVWSVSVKMCLPCVVSVCKRCGGGRPTDCEQVPQNDLKNPRPTIKSKKREKKYVPGKGRAAARATLQGAAGRGHKGPGTFTHAGCLQEKILHRFPAV